MDVEEENIYMSDSKKREIDKLKKQFTKEAKEYLISE